MRIFSEFLCSHTNKTKKDCSSKWDHWLAKDKWNVVAQTSRRQKLLGNKMILKINFGIHAWMGKWEKYLFSITAHESKSENIIGNNWMTRQVALSWV